MLKSKRLDIYPVKLTIDDENTVNIDCFVYNDDTDLCERTQLKYYNYYCSIKIVSEVKFTIEDIETLQNKIGDDNFGGHFEYKCSNLFSPRYGKDKTPMKDYVYVVKLSHRLSGTKMYYLKEVYKVVEEDLNYSLIKL